MTHLHMSFLFATLAFLPGLFWGWLFSRRRNLVGVTLSHAVVGGYVFFILGVAI
jgi:membrane protease YdiL (CAAX protease family)